MSNVSLYCLPHHGRVRATIATLKKRVSGEYQYIRVRRDWVCFYVADEAVTADSEWWLDTLIEDGHVTEDESFVLIEECQGDSGRYWQCTNVEDGVVKALWTQHQAQWGSSLIGLSSRILLCGDVPGVEGEAVPAKPMAPPSLGQYLLVTPKRYTKHLFILGLLCALSVVAVGIWHQHETIPKPTEKAQQIDKPEFGEVTTPPWALYRLALNMAFSAEQTLTPAYHLAAYAATLPPGWSAQDIAIENGALTSAFVRETTGLVSVMDAWLETHPALASFTTQNASEVRFHQTVSSGLPEWMGKVMPIDPSWQNLQDALTVMGFEATLMDAGGNLNAPWQHRQWSVKKEAASLADLSHLNTLLTQLPAGLDALNLKPVSQGVWSVSFTLNLYGGL